MPEGHTIHRYARLHRDLLGGHTVAAWSPQGRFAAWRGHPRRRVPDRGRRPRQAPLLPISLPGPLRAGRWRSGGEQVETLFLVGVHPDRSARQVDRATFDGLWTLLVRLLRDGERRGRIITVQPEDRTRPPSRLHRDERVYVYKRTGLPCRRCGTPIRAWDLAARTMYACPTCQPA